MNLITRRNWFAFLALLFAFHATAQNLEKVLKGFQFRSVGPTRQGGRYVDFAVPEGQSATFYAATATGGLWKTYNHGHSFESIFDNQGVISLGAVAVAPSNPEIIWLGTGEGNNSRSVYWGKGVFLSKDAGKTWTSMGLEETQHIGRIVIHPANPDVVYVAALGHLYTENEERGLYKTMDGGMTWIKVLNVVAHGKNIGVVDVVMNPQNPDILFAAAYDKVRKPWTFNVGGPGSGIYKTVDGGRTWEKCTQGLPGGMLGRIGLTLFPKNPNILYAVIENANKPGMPDEERYQELLDGKSSEGIIGNEIYRTDDCGANWRKVSEEKANLGGSPPYYYGQVRVDPNDENHVYNLMVSVVESKDGGKTWRRAFRFGGDNHALWIDPKDSGHMLLGHDHGMGITFDGGINWHHPDNIPLAQFYAIGVDMEYPYNIYGGTQDNGSLKGPSLKRDGSYIVFEDWKRVGGGDGFYNVVDPTESRWLYNESQFGAVNRIDQWTDERVSIRPPGDSLRFNWSTPILISPHDSRVIYIGTNKLMKSNNRGDTWEAVSPDLTNPDPKKLTVDGKGGDGNIEYSTITTVDESPLEKGVIWVGTDDGNVQVTRDGGKTWTLCNSSIPQNPGFWVSRVTASFHEAGTAFVSMTGYRHDDFRPFVYKTTDYGKTWISLTGNLPNESVNGIKQDKVNPNLILIGTDLSIYLSLDGGKIWNRFNNNMPDQPVHDLLIHPRENDLIVGTHGRGIFMTDIFPLQELTPEILKKKVHLFDIESKVRWVAKRGNESSSSNYNGEGDLLGISIYYYLKEGMQGPVTMIITNGDVVVSEIKGEKKPGLHRIIWDMTQRKMRSDAEIEEFKNRIAGWREFQETDRYTYDPVSPDRYKVTLKCKGVELQKWAEIIQDTWTVRR